MHVNSAGKSSSTTRVAKEAIDYAARQTGVSFDYLMAQAKIESSYDPLAKAKKSSAAGLFQFTKQTWLSTLEKHGAAAWIGLGCRFHPKKQSGPVFGNRSSNSISNSGSQIRPSSCIGDGCQTC